MQTIPPDSLCSDPGMARGYRGQPQAAGWPQGDLDNQRYHDPHRCVTKFQIRQVFATLSVTAQSALDDRLDSQSLMWFRTGSEASSLLTDMAYRGIQTTLRCTGHCWRQRTGGGWRVHGCTAFRVFLCSSNSSGPSARSCPRLKEFKLSISLILCSYGSVYRSQVPRASRHHAFCFVQRVHVNPRVLTSSRAIHAPTRYSPQAHRSQAVWYRNLFVIFSRYTYANSLVEL